jgi:ABC-type branched-subunit amino acid transport system substrate-binding protein
MTNRSIGRCSSTDGRCSSGRGWPARLRHSVALAAGLSILCAGLTSLAPESGASSKYGLVIADVDPFSGPTAAYGSYEQAGCIPAVNLINENGGIFGHDLSCKIVDTRGDPADAVPAVQQMLATTSHLVGIVDQDSGLLGVTVPLTNAATSRSTTVITSTSGARFRGTTSTGTRSRHTSSTSPTTRRWR